MTGRNTGLTAVILIAAGTLYAQSFQRVKDTVHNLSVTGPGEQRAATETEVCVFCHTPHGSTGVQPLWNRTLPTGPYEIYRSSSLEARPGQPTGSSKLCLSCHDGTIALGDVASRAGPIAMLRADRLGPGQGGLGTDLSDDHPISFPYAAAASTATHELVHPAAIRPPVGLDEAGELQCTSCHDAHDNSRGEFLLRPTESGELCLSCHRPENWTDSAHATSARSLPPETASRLGTKPGPLQTVACGGCHRAHDSPSGPWILGRENIAATCIECHDGIVAETDIRREILKPSNHGMLAVGRPTPTGGLHVEGERVSCSDCHDPHAVGAATSTGSALRSLAGVPGATLAGAPIEPIAHPHELCLRCHGDTPARVRPVVSRVIVQPNVRLQFQPTNPSFHPVGNPGPSSFVPSLAPPLTNASTIECGDCHDSDASRAAGGSGPAGPHGSVHRPLLAKRYETMDFTVESPSAYALCYGCHQRNSILADESFPFHRLHIVEERTPCSVCHDAHGIDSAQGSATENAHLINFDRAVVVPSARGELEYASTGHRSGTCSLTCHGENHDRLGYGRP